MRLFLSEWMKTKRTAVRWITFFLPVLIACCVITYMMYRTELSSDFIYEGFFHGLDSNHYAVRRRAAVRISGT